jgi:hypothetical protein
VAARVEQAAIVMLAVDLDEQSAELAQHSRRDRLVVDEGAAAAVRLDQPADDQRLAAVAGRPFSSSSASAGWPAARSKATLTEACFWPLRTRPLSARLPSASPSASSRIDLPAPVSPVSTPRPGPNSRSSVSISTTSRIERPVSMSGGREATLLLSYIRRLGCGP